MIITKLIGGIGNQMFQYAIARSIANTNQTDFKMDTSGFESYTLREYKKFKNSGFDSAILFQMQKYGWITSKRS